MKTNSAQLYDQIDLYLSGEMDEKERARFDEKINRNKQLKKVVGQHKELVEGIRFSVRRRNLEMLRSLENELSAVPDQEPAMQTGSYKSYLAVAATIVLLAVAAFVIIKLSTATSHQELYATYYHPYPNIVNAIKRSDHTDNQSTVDQAYQLYEQGQYTNAIQYFEKVSAADKTAPVIFYTGSAYLASDQPEKAISAFREVIERHEEFNIQAQWYLGLAHLKTGNAEQAREILLKIASEENSYAKLAESILEKM